MRLSVNRPPPAPTKRLAAGLAVLALIVLGVLALPALLARRTPPRAVEIAEELQRTFRVEVGAVAGPACYWRDALELEWTSTAVVRVADTVGGPVRFVDTMAGPVRMARVPVPELRAFAPPVGQDVLGDIVLTDYNFDHGENYAVYLIVHEIGHVLDWRSHKELSREVAAETGARQCDPDNPSITCVFDARSAVEPPPGDPAQPYAATSTEEYWAEVFASTVYPDYYGQNTANNPVGPQTQEVVRTSLGAIAD